MSSSDPARIPIPIPSNQLPTGVPGLDEVLGGGIPEQSCTVIAGGAGSGKTTLALQFAFANASCEQPAVYFSGPGQPPERLLRYHEHLKFFDPERVDRDVHFVNIGRHFEERDAARVLDTLQIEIAAFQPTCVVVDIPLSLTPPSLWTDIVLFLAASRTTSVLVADCVEELEPRVQAVLATADNLVWLQQEVENRQSRRTVCALKTSGQAPLPGAHAVELTWQGMRVFPRWASPPRHLRRCHSQDRLSVGVDAIDQLLAGGVPAGDSIVVQGPSGSGKSILASQFIAENGHLGLPGLVVLFEERPDRFIARAESLDLQLSRLVRGGLVDVVSFRGRDLCADELIHLVQRAIDDIGAQCVVLDSTAGLELLLGGSTVLRDCLWRLIDTVTAAGVTLWLNHTPTEASQLGWLADNVLQLERVGLASEGRVERRLAVLKLSDHARGSGVVVYEIGARGVQPLPAAMPTPMPREEYRPPNGHLVNYRYAG